MAMKWNDEMLQPMGMKEASLRLFSCDLLTRLDSNIFFHWDYVRVLFFSYPYENNFILNYVSNLI